MNIDLTYDLHCHSNCSDGHLPPADLIARAKNNGAEYLSITDHDTVAAYAEGDLTINEALTLVPGIEFSSQWRGRGIHLVGLNIDVHDISLNDGISEQQQTRVARAHTIASRLIRRGIEISVERVFEIAGSSTIGRPHFAQHMVEIGAVGSAQQAFKKFLGTGKIGDIRRNWADVPTVVNWITGAGGTAVLAHPAHYRLTHRKLSELLDDFVAAGGSALEVISGSQQSSVTKQLAGLSVDKGLLASCGSDFHGPDVSWSDVGRVQALPGECTPVWEHW